MVELEVGPAICVGVSEPTLQKWRRLVVLLEESGIDVHAPPAPNGDELCVEVPVAQLAEIIDEVDSARCALRALVEALSMDDRPRLAAIELARRTCKKWEAER